MVRSNTVKDGGRTVLLTVFWVAFSIIVYILVAPQKQGALVSTTTRLLPLLSFGFLSILAVAAFPKTALIRVGERLSFIAALVEVLYSTPSLHRNCNGAEWIAITIVICGVLLVVATYRIQDLRKKGFRHEIT